jgi:RNA-binding protein
LTSSPELTSKQRKHLSRLGTQLKPVVTVGKDGVSDSVLASLEQCFRNRELVKARIRVDDPVERKSVAAALAKASGSALVQVLGKNILIYRKAAPDANVEERIEF